MSAAAASGGAQIQTSASMRSKSSQGKYCLVAGGRPGTHTGEQSQSRIERTRQTLKQESFAPLAQVTVFSYLHPAFTSRRCRHDDSVRSFAAYRVTSQLPWCPSFAGYSRSLSCAQPCSRLLAKSLMRCHRSQDLGRVFISRRPPSAVLDQARHPSLLNYKACRSIICNLG